FDRMVDVDAPVATRGYREPHLAGVVPAAAEQPARRVVDRQEECSRWEHGAGARVIVVLVIGTLGADPGTAAIARVDEPGPHLVGPAVGVAVDVHPAAERGGGTVER